MAVLSDHCIDLLKAFGVEVEDLVECAIVFRVGHIVEAHCRYLIDGAAKGESAPDVYSFTKKYELVEK